MNSLFNICNEEIDRVLKVALSRGGEYADIYFEYTASDNLTLMDGSVNNAESHIDYGVGIRVISGQNSGYGYSESMDIENILKAAEYAAQIATSNTSSVNISPYKKKIFQNYHPIIMNWDDISITERKNFLLELNERIFQSDTKVTKVVERLSNSISNILFYNSLGETFSDIRPMASLSATCVMESNGRIETFNAGKSYRKGGDFLTKELSDIILNSLIDGCNRLFKAKQPKGGVMPVVMGAGSSGILLHEAIGHAFEADFNRKKTSIFCDKMGKKICDSSINIVDDGTIPFNRGSVNIDDEGVLGQKTYMVKDGILNSYLHDRISAKYYNTQPTGNGRRESFRFIPIPRMRATYMENGSCSEEELIKEVKNGIFVDTFSNGQVQIGAGDFTFFVKSGYLIENGKLSTPIKDINIIGNGPQALADIQLVANNSFIDDGTWTCGKEQYCPVSCGMPSVLIKELNVGGVN
jgi:TldD protein